MLTLFPQVKLSTLYVIRHAQASFLESNYDKLSALGETQSLLLGGHFVNSGLTFDRVFIGPRERQIKTGELAGSVFRNAGLPWPTPEPTPELDEYQGDVLIQKALPRLMDEDIHLQTLAASFAETEHTDKRSRARSFQKMFEHVMLRWVRGEISEPGVEPWADFTERVARFLKKLQSSAAKGERVAAFTSGGTVGATVQHALGFSNEKAIELSWMVKNSTVTELTYNPERLTLGGFNTHPHLQHEKLITYR